MSFFVPFRSLSEAKGSRECVGLDESLKVEFERLRELAGSVEPLVDWNVLRKNGRSVGIQAATMTTFCSILNLEVSDCRAKKWGGN
jgi:hypothetical protein